MLFLPVNDVALLGLFYSVFFRVLHSVKSMVEMIAALVISHNPISTLTAGCHD